METQTHMQDRRLMLKIKLKSLAEESKIIRALERKTPGGQLRNELALHRRGAVRWEAHRTHLAYAIVRGKDVGTVQGGMTMQILQTLPDWKAIEAMVKRYGAKNVMMSPRARSSTAEQRLLKPSVAGSIPAEPSIHQPCLSEATPLPAS